MIWVTPGGSAVTALREVDLRRVGAAHDPTTSRSMITVGGSVTTAQYSGPWSSTGTLHWSERSLYVAFGSSVGLFASCVRHRFSGPRNSVGRSRYCYSAISSQSKRKRGIGRSD